ncbi:MAG: UbiA family prenyltransferase [Xanthomonadales bacterium]|nr:UbiA family prenyltransferase [Xanthomonadales bacterium]
MRRFLALSRSTHGVLDIAMPGFVALLWLGSFPSRGVLGLCLLTALAGYTAIYALNDLIGFKDDRAKVAGGLKPGYAVEASALRYPLAQGLITMKGALAWFGFWFILAMIGVWLLNPWIMLILLGAALLEVLYVKLLRVTGWRTVVSGLVKAAGPLAAVLAVVPDPSVSGLALMLGWLMCWEIGGQNIPADWNDIEEDRLLGARTIPLVLGTRAAAAIAAGLLLLATVLSLVLPTFSPLPSQLALQSIVLIAGCALLLWPSLRLMRSGEGRDAARLFDLASLYPLALLVGITVLVVFDALQGSIIGG